MNLTYEEAYKQLEEIIEKLQSQETSIDESIELFKKGIELQKFCDEKLKTAEKKIIEVLNENDTKEEYVHEKDQ